MAFYKLFLFVILKNQKQTQLFKSGMPVKSHSATPQVNSTQKCFLLKTTHLILHQMTERREVLRQVFTNSNPSVTSQDKPYLLF